MDIRKTRGEKAMNLINKTLASLPIAILLGLGMGVFYLLAIMYYVTGRLPDVSVILDSLSGLEQIAKALGG
jgi:hypothetical protein